MKYEQKDFTEELKIKIKNTDSAIKKHIEKLLNENKTVFLRRTYNLMLISIKMAMTLLSLGIVPQLQ